MAKVIEPVKVITLTEAAVKSGLPFKFVQRMATTGKIDTSKAAGRYLMPDTELENLQELFEKHALVKEREALERNKLD